MCFSLRLLTIVAFSAHAVLGCCLSHGDCHRQHAPLAGSIGCDHDHHAEEGHHAELGHHHNHSQMALSESAGEEPLVSTTCAPVDEGHSHHCDDTQCVFSATAGAPSVACHLAMSVNVSWVGVLMDLRHQPICSGKQTRRSTDQRALTCENEALLQVWQI